MTTMGRFSATVQHIQRRDARAQSAIDRRALIHAHHHRGVGAFGFNRGRFAGDAAAVGNALYHSVGDREAALEQLATDFATLQNEVMKAAGFSADPYHEASGPIYVWWVAAGLPTVNAWQKFHSDQTANYGVRWATSWDVYEGWQRRLQLLRDSASKMVKLTSPAPSKLPTTIFEDAGGVIGDAKDKLGEGFTLIKVAIYGGLGIAGAIALTSIASNLRSGSDPVTSWRKK